MIGKGNANFFLQFLLQYHLYSQFYLLIKTVP